MSENSRCLVVVKHWVTNGSFYVPIKCFALILCFTPRVLRLLSLSIYHKLVPFLSTHLHSRARPFTSVVWCHVPAYIHLRGFFIFIFYFYYFLSGGNVVTSWRIPMVLSLFFYFLFIFISYLARCCKRTP
ncbi:hypothetical protein HOY82DRAFT_153056 [Tuber indicum]|nr:hypothetical protein HOY82DRAFT_153056 [Tuber indicum]